MTPTEALTRLLSGPAHAGARRTRLLCPLHLGPLAHAGVDTLELSTEGDLVDAVVRFADLRRQRTRRGTGGALPRHLHQAA